MVSSTSRQSLAIRRATLSMKVPSPAPISRMWPGGRGKNFRMSDAMIGAWNISALMRRRSRREASARRSSAARRSRISGMRLRWASALMRRS
ncbi:hypothetical protein [Mesorhizobium sp.]|uniref:hypothetical protein n=1 Tax=Mesorhizobium sp. TaxID=1871066 RepID=UPI0025BE85E9|nr:hypothetical protein [Mesorhizobium sp.]